MILKVSTSLSCSGRADCLNFSLPLYRVCEEPRGYCQPKGGTSLKLQRLAKSRRKSRCYVNHQPHSKELFSSPTERIQDLRQRLQEEETASKNVKHLPPVLWPLASQIAQHKFAKPYMSYYMSEWFVQIPYLMLYTRSLQVDKNRYIWLYPHIFCILDLMSELQ